MPERNLYPNGREYVPVQLGTRVEAQGLALHDPDCPNSTHGRLQLQCALRINGEEFYWPLIGDVAFPEISGWQKLGGIWVVDIETDTMTPHILNNNHSPCKWWLKKDYYLLTP